MKIKDRVASGLGSVLEWYDFALYGFFAPLIATLYFPHEAEGVALLKTFSIFAIGFFSRPVGAVLFGAIGDKYGRTASLKITPVLITFPTLLLAVLSTYDQIGIYAPITLTLIRILQGICIGGEYANNIVYLCESVKTKRVFFMGSLGSCTGSLGILIASGMASAFYFIFMFLPNFLSESIGSNSSSVLGDNTISLSMRLFIIPIIGLLADALGGLLIARIASILFLFLSYPLFFGILHSPDLIFPFAFIFAILTTLNAAITPGLLMKLLNPTTRCTVLSITFNLCFGVFGGLVPVLSFFLINNTGNQIAPVFYLMFSALVSFIATFFFKDETRYA